MTAKVKLKNNSRVSFSGSFVTVEIPESATIRVIHSAELPDGWEKIPYLEELADIAEHFWIMRVPSAHSPTEFSYVLNPLHPEHTTLKLISVGPHSFDMKLK